MIPFVLATLALAAPPQEIDLDKLLEGMTPEQLLARRVTPEHLVARKAGPAVVFISTDIEVQSADFFGRIYRSTQPLGSGSGAVIRPEGFIVTNYHVVAGAKHITVEFDKSLDSHDYSADLVSFVAEEDLALLKIRSVDGSPFPTIELGTSSDLMVGERVVAIGNPYGQTHTVSGGIISGLHRGVDIASPMRTLPNLHFDDLIQTDASINRGNSGGPLLNINGELIGINNAVNVQAENIGFAIPVDRVKVVLEQQLVSPDRSRAWLGFEIDEDDRLRVKQVVPGSPAELAGLRPDDLIVALDGQALAKLDAFKLARVAIGPDRAVELRVQRGREQKSLQLKPLEKADGLILEHLGLRVDLVYWNRVSYLRVAEVVAGGPAAEIGLAAGDLLEMVRPLDGNDQRARRVHRRQDLAQLLALLGPGTSLQTYVRREGEGLVGTLVLR